MLLSQRHNSVLFLWRPVWFARYSELAYLDVILKAYRNGGWLSVFDTLSSPLAQLVRALH